MKLLVSCTHNGSIKEIVFNKGTNTSVLTAPQPLYVKTHLIQGAPSAVCQITRASNGLILLTRNNGSIDLVKRIDVPVSSVAEPEEATEKETVKEETKAGEQVEILEKPEFDVGQYETISTVDGLLDNSKLEIVFKNSTKRTKIYDTFVSVNSLPGKPKTFLVATKSGMVHIINIGKKNILEKLFTHELKAPLDFVQVYDNAKVTKSGFVFACGGEENLIKLIQLKPNFSEIKMIWEAKNVSNDRLDLRVPIWPTAVRFLNPACDGKIDSDKLNYQLVTVTHWSHLGVYKTQHGRKPMKYTDLLPNREPLSQLEMVGPEDKCTPSGNLKTDDLDNFTFVTTDLKRDILKFNNTGHLLGKFGKGDITGHSTFIKVFKGKYLLQGGLDRYVRVFDIESTDLLAKIYVTGKVNYITMEDEEDVLLPENKPKKETKAAKRRREIAEETEQDAEALWNKLENKAKKTKI